MPTRQPVYGGRNFNERPASLPKSKVETPELNMQTAGSEQEFEKRKQHVKIYQAARKGEPWAIELLEGGNSTFATNQAWRVAGTGTSGSGQILQGPGSHLGAAVPFDSEVILLLQLNEAVFQQYDLIARMYPPYRGLNERSLLQLVQSTLYNQLKTMMMVDINNLAPRDSGRLRNAMELSIMGGHSGGGGATSMVSDLHPFFVILNTGDLPYAKPVNYMPTNWLAHPHPGSSNEGYKFGRRITRQREGSYQTARGTWKHYLYDPRAETHWFFTIRDKGRTYAHQLYSNFVGSTLPTWMDLEPVIRFYSGYYNQTMQQGQTPPVLSSYQVALSIFSVRYA